MRFYGAFRWVFFAKIDVIITDEAPEVFGLCEIDTSSGQYQGAKLLRVIPDIGNLLLFQRAPLPIGILVASCQTPDWSDIVPFECILEDVFYSLLLGN